VDDADFLIYTLQQLNTITINWSGSLYCGLTLAWDYLQRTVDVSYQGILNALSAPFSMSLPPASSILPMYGSLHPTVPPSNMLSPTIYLRLSMHALSITSKKSSARSCTTRAQLIAPCSWRSDLLPRPKQTALRPQPWPSLSPPSATLSYHASDMVVHAHTDASYLSEKHAPSRSGGIFFISSALPNPLRAPSPTSTPPPLNGAVHVHSSIMSVVLSSATEAELGALFYNGKEAAMLRIILSDMGHPQPVTPIQTDNTCAAGIANGTVKKWRSKATDMRFYWIKDRAKQGQFFVHWRRGTDNLADYFTKRHSPAHHRAMRSRYLIDLHV
jgi:hypothetical protein